MTPGVVRHSTTPYERTLNVWQMLLPVSMSIKSPLGVDAVISPKPYKFATRRDPPTDPVLGETETSFGDSSNDLPSTTES